MCLLNNFGCLLVLITVPFAVNGQWSNEYNKELNFQCDDGFHIYYLVSEFNGNKRDRRWGFDCRKGFVTDECEWSGWINRECGSSGNIDDKYRLITYKCPNKGIITGFQSVQSDGKLCQDKKKRDRKWKVRCCKPNTMEIGQLLNTQFIHETAEDIDWSIIEGRVMRGFRAEYDPDHWNDRRWRLQVADAHACYARNMTITGPPKVVPQKSKVIGIATGLNCNPDIMINMEQGDMKATEETTEVTTSKSNSYMFEQSIGIDLEISAGFMGNGGKFGVGFTASVGSGYGTGESTTLGTSHYTESNAMQTIDYMGPMGVMVLGIQDEYKVEDPVAVAKYGVDCTNGASHFVQDKVKLSTKSYGKTHFVTKTAVFADQATCVAHQDAVENCFAALEGQLMIDDDFSFGDANIWNKCFEDANGRFVKSITW